MVEVSTLNGTDGFVIEGESAGDRAGRSVAPAGDVNDDGLDDLIVGSPGAAAGDGAAYIVYGASTFSTPFPLSSVNGTNGVRITGAAGDSAGTDVAGAGDVNADGIDDAVIGAPGVTTASGRAYVVYGDSALPSPLPLSGLNGGNGFTIPGIDAGDATGFAVAGVGDMNADGHDDLLIGAPHADGTANSLPDAGEAYVVFGPALSIAPEELPAGIVGIAYSLTFTATRGTAPYAFSTASALPPGLSFDPSGVLSGTPVQEGSYLLMVDVADAVGCVARRQYQLMVRPAPDFVVGQGLGLPNLNRVRVFDSAGAATPVDFMAYAAGRWGVNVATVGIDQDSPAEILAGPGPGETFGPQVRAFENNGTPIGRVNFYAYGTLRFGVNVGAGDVDGDTFAEILSGAGPGDVFGPHVRGWNFDGVALTALTKINFFAYATLKWGVNAADGNVDGDRFLEMLTGPGPGPSFAPTVRGWNYDNAALTVIPKLSFSPYSFRHGVIVAGGDVDADAFAEIVTVPGPGPTNPAWFRGFDYDGGTLSPLPGFDANSGGAYGGRVGVGVIGSDAMADLLTGAGRDPAAASTVTSYDYDGLALTLLPNGFTPFAPGYGVNLSAGFLGY